MKVFQNSIFSVKELFNWHYFLKFKDSYQNIVQRKVSQKNHEASNENDNIDLKFLSYETSGRGVLVQVCQDIADKQLSEDHEYKVIDKNLINKKILSKQEFMRWCEFIFIFWMELVYYKIF